MTRHKDALDAALATVEEIGGIAALRAEMDAFRNLRLLVYAKYPQLQRDYPNQWIAMSEDGLLAFGDSHDAVMKALRESDVDMSDVVLEYINTEDSVFIL